MPAARPYSLALTALAASIDELTGATSSDERARILDTQRAVLRVLAELVRQDQARVDRIYDCNRRRHVSVEQEAAELELVRRRWQELVAISRRASVRGAMRWISARDDIPPARVRRYLKALGVCRSTVKHTFAAEPLRTIERSDISS